MARSKFEPNANNCTVQIKVDHETEKAYAVYAGSTGGYLNCRSFYEYIAKSICYVDGNKVFAPSWAVRNIPCKSIIRDGGSSFYNDDESEDERTKAFEFVINSMNEMLQQARTEEEKKQYQESIEKLKMAMANN